jgi:hypothetical protein
VRFHPIEGSDGVDWRRDRRFDGRWLNAESGDRVEQPTPVANRGDTELLEVVACQRREDRGIDVVITKHRGVPLQAKVT